MVYDTARNALYYTGGVQGLTVDFNNTWMYSLDNPSNGWVAKAPIPYAANHLSYVTAKDATGRERHFIFGGQNKENECCTNHADNYEWDAINEVWIQRASLPFARGHAASSTRAIGCGFLTAGGAINSPTGQRLKTNDISYYDIPTDRWMSLGILTTLVKSTVCDLRDGYLYCETGSGTVSVRRPIAF